MGWTIQLLLLIKGTAVYGMQVSFCYYKAIALAKCSFRTFDGCLEFFLLVICQMQLNDVFHAVFSDFDGNGSKLSFMPYGPSR